MSNKVSILTNNYNGSFYIKKFIESLYMQTFNDWELIFYDNCSSDNSLDILNQYQKNDTRIKIFHNKKFTGLGYARSEALKKCNYDYVAVWDVDDTSEKDRLLLQFKFLEKNYEISLVASNVLKKINKSTIKYILSTSPDTIRSQLYWRNIIVHSSVMYRRKIALKIGGYNSNFNYSQDYNFYIKLLVNNYKISSIDKFLCTQNISTDGLSKSYNMKKTIIKDQINNLLNARDIKDINYKIKILNHLSKIFYSMKLLFV